MKTTYAKTKILFCTIQVLYWINHCLMFIFISKFLQGKGYADSQIGICLGATYGATALVGPMIADYFQRHRIPLNKGMLGQYTIVMALGAVLLLVPAGKMLTGVMMVIILTTQCSMQASVNSLHRAQLQNGVQLNFSFARGLGSFCYAITAYLVGKLLTEMPSDRLPILYLISVALTMVCLGMFATPALETAKDKQSEHSARELLRMYPKFGAFLIGVVCISFAHSYMDTYLLQVFQSLGGDTAQQGIAVSVAGLVELPAMVLYSKAAKRTGCRPMLILCGWAWVLKMLVLTLAKTPNVAIASMLLQFFSFAVYAPASVDYVTDLMDKCDQLKGQAMVCSFWMVGSFLCAVIGGIINQAYGVRTTLPILTCVCTIGAVLFTVASAKKRSK